MALGKRICNGCGKYVPGGRCPNCTKRREAKRGTARERGYTTQWDKYARAYLMEHPMCVYCKAKGRDVVATCVDHVKPASSHPELFWEPTNHAAACTPCNVAKGANASF